MRRNLLEQILLYDYRYLIAYTLIIITALITHLWRLGDVLPGLSRFEADYVANLSWGGLLDNPLYWPHKMLTLVAAENFVSEAFWLRLVSVVFALMAAIMFFYLLRNRFKDRVAIIAVGLLITSSWWLHYARLARPEILVPLATFGLMLLAKKAHETSDWRWLMPLTILVGASLYVPSMPYIIIVGAFVTRSLIKQIWRNLKLPVKVSLLVTIVILTVPLLFAVGRDVGLLRDLLLLPDSWVTPLAVLQAILDNLGEIFWHREAFWPLGLGTLPYLDLFTAVMVALGLYHLDHEISRSLAYFVLVGLGVLLVLVSLQYSPTDSIVLLPFLYILVAAGIVMLLTQWYEIFPRNPIARLTAFIPTAFLLLSVVWYHQQRYFVAWPRTPEIVNEFPPLSSSVTTLAKSTNGDLTIYVTEDEQNLAQAATLSFPNALVTTDQSVALAQNNVVLSQAAYEGLGAKDQSMWSERLQSVPTAYSIQPISVWTNIE